MTEDNKALLQHFKGKSSELFSKFFESMLKDPVDEEDAKHEEDRKAQPKYPLDQINEATNKAVGEICAMYSDTVTYGELRALCGMVTGKDDAVAELEVMLQCPALLKKVQRQLSRDVSERDRARLKNFFVAVKNMEDVQKRSTVLERLLQTIALLKDEGGSISDPRIIQLNALREECEDTKKVERFTFDNTNAKFQQFEELLNPLRSHDKHHWFFINALVEYKQLWEFLFERNLFLAYARLRGGPKYHMLDVNRIYMSSSVICQVLVHDCLHPLCHVCVHATVKTKKDLCRK